MFLRKYNTLWRRFLAVLIDGLILLLLYYFDSFLTVNEMPVPIIVIGVIIYYFCNHFYYIYLHAVYGQTLGKMIMKLKVTDIEGNSIGFKKAFLREFPLIIYSFLLLSSEIYQVIFFGITENFRSTIFDNAILTILTVWLIIEFAVALSNEKRRAIHDYIAGTVVIRED